jgi:type II secretory pathway predicted ATPase ExeA
MTLITNNKKHLALYGLSYNPFSPDVPAEGLFRSPRIESFAWRVEHLILDGGMALITGDPGLGKSVALRILNERFKDLKDVTVAYIDRPQSNISDFYREVGDCFGLSFRPGNRWGGYKALREKWRRHIETTLFRPILLVDEAQEMPSQVLSELRLLAAENFDSRRLLTIVLAGDERLRSRLKSADLAPVDSRMRSRLHLEPHSNDELMTMLVHAVEFAGNKNLITQGLRQTLVEHAAGNPRVMMHIADELLSRAVAEERPQIDEKLFFDLVGERQSKRRGPPGVRT